MINLKKYKLKLSNVLIMLSYSSSSRSIILLFVCYVFLPMLDKNFRAEDVLYVEAATEEGSINKKEVDVACRF